MNSENWNQRYAQREFIWSLDPTRQLVSEIDQLIPARALDLACGEGRNALWLAQQGWQVTAVDFSAVALDKARQRANALDITVDWVQADVTHYQPTIAAFDLVLMIYLQLPSDERQIIMRQAHEALAPGGTFVYIGHDLSNLKHGWGGPQDAAVLCTPQDVVADLPDFDIIKDEVVERLVVGEPGHGNPGPTGAIALDALVRAVRRC